jgi:hypothetical protein
LGKTAERIYRHIKKNKQEEKHEIVSPKQSAPPPKTYLKALPLRSLLDVDRVKHEINAGNILILQIRALAKKSVEDVKQAVNELCEFTQEIGGDIARLGEERVVITPKTVRIWREKPSVTEKNPAASP